MTDLRDRLAAALAPRYIVDRELGAGGMGVVYLGHDPILGREVAIKVLPPERATAVAIERFLREARLLAQLAHPHIVTILEASQAGELIWFVMPRVEGDTLAHRLMTGPLPASQVRRLGMDLLSALEHAHSHGVIHRDIKPANIFLHGERALLADFGVALLESPPGDTLTGTDQLVGTLRYMAPEQWAGEATERSDVYALGVTLFEAATGQRWALSDRSTGRRWRAVPNRLRGALRGALHSDPARRWQDAATFRRALAATRSQPRRGWLLVGAAAVFATVSVLVVRTLLSAPVAANAPVDLVVLRFDGAGDSLGGQLARFTSMPIEFSPIAVMPWVRVGRLTLDSARHLSRSIVTGAFVTRDGQIDALDIQVHDSSGRILDDLRVPGRLDDPAAWGQAIADSIVRRLFWLRLPEFRQLAGVRPNRMALDTFAEGQRLFQGGDWGAAEAKFTIAESLDSLLVQASWQRLIARQWQRLPFEDELMRLDARRDRLPQPLGELVRLQLEQDLEHRIAGFDSLARLPQFKDYSMVREMQANELFSRGALIGRPLREGIEAFRLAARQVPDLDQATTYTQTVWGAVRIGDERLAVEQLALRKAAKGDPWTGMLWLAVKGRFQRWLAVPVRTFMLWTANADDIVTLSRAVRMGLSVDDPWDQEAIAKTLARRATSDRERASALAGQATALLLVGRPAAALDRLDRAAEFVPRDAGFQLQRGEWRVLLPLLPGVTIPIAERVRDAGRRILRAVGAGDAIWPRAAWALAVDAVARRDSHACDSLVALLRARAVAPGVADLATLAEAIGLGAAGLTDSALVLSRRIHVLPREADAAARGPFARALVYLHRGAWQQRRGDSAGAEREWLWHENNDVQGWPSGAPDAGEIDAALSAVARLLRAENLPALDRTADACRLLDRVAVLWRDAEPVLQPLRARVVTGRTDCRS